MLLDPCEVSVKLEDRARNFDEEDEVDERAGRASLSSSLASPEEVLLAEVFAWVTARLGPCQERER